MIEKRALKAEMAQKSLCSSLLLNPDEVPFSRIDALLQGSGVTTQNHVDFLFIEFHQLADHCNVIYTLKLSSQLLSAKTA